MYSRGFSIPLLPPFLGLKQNPVRFRFFFFVFPVYTSTPFGIAVTTHDRPRLEKEKKSPPTTTTNSTRLIRRCLLSGHGTLFIMVFFFFLCSRSAPLGRSTPLVVVCSLESLERSMPFGFAMYTAHGYAASTKKKRKKKKKKLNKIR